MLRSYPKSAITDAAVAIGIVGEVAFGMWDSRIQTELRDRSNKRVAEATASAAEANERASNADLARAELEAKLLPRTLNRDQWDFIQGLRGKFSEIAIASETDVETQFFAAGIRDAFFAAGIRVAMYPRAPEVHLFGNLIFEPNGFDGSRARTVEPLIEIFRKSEFVGSLGVITEIPSDIMVSIHRTAGELRAPLDTPMIIVGGRLVLLPPHLEKAGKAARAESDQSAS